MLSAGLSHAADEITEVPAHDESESRSKPNIWTSLAPRGAGERLCSQQAACQQPAQRSFLTNCHHRADSGTMLCCPRRLPAGAPGTSTGIRGPCAVTQSRPWRRGLVRVPCAGWGLEMLHFESPHPPSLSGSHGASRQRFLRQREVVAMQPAHPSCPRAGPGCGRHSGHRMGKEMAPRGQAFLPC